MCSTEQESNKASQTIIIIRSLFFRKMDLKAP